ncbi:MAG TPA: S1C family serine protease [Gemmatimonadaceae bacterium]|nr:S1C family serine protease [Gemmatimonadaceae bacterium]
MTTTDASARLAPLQALSDGLADAVDRAARSVVAIHARPRIPSSGIVWRAGIIVSAHHTVKRDEDIAITLADGSDARASVVGRDPSTDLVALQLSEGTSATPATLSPDEPRVGQLVLAVGRPGSEGATASLGVVSAVGGAWHTWAGGEIDRFVRLDLSIYDGFSGGVLVDASSRVLGLNSSALARGAAVSIPVRTVERVVTQLLATGRVERGYLGLAMQPVRLGGALASRLALRQEAGLLVVHVEGDGPADRAGLLVGDVIVAAEGRPVGDLDDLLGLLRGDRVGTTVPLRLVRGGTLLEVPVAIGARPRRPGRGA